jgi:pentatricopeptide repeat protein
MKQSGIDFSKEVFVALIHAYAAYGEFEKAKQVCVNIYVVFVPFLFRSDLVKDIACCP